MKGLGEASDASQWEGRPEGENLAVAVETLESHAEASGGEVARRAGFFADFRTFFRHDETPDGARTSEVAEAGLGRSIEKTGDGHERPTSELRAQFPGEYVEPGAASASVERFTDPREFVGRINPHRDGGENAYQVNCADCARSVEATWRGRAEVAGGLADPDAEGEDPSRTEQWYGRTFRSATPDEVGRILATAGPGASALVEVQYTVDEYGIAKGYGHAFNAVNLEGHILLVDGQVGQVETWSRWPPSGWDPSTRLHRMRFIGWDAQDGAI